MQQWLQHPLVVPILSLVAGIVIFIFPRVLNFIVALYLVLVGVFGLITYFSN
ncbi:MAG: hypothetical protein K940chlam9_00784 [Chlamydiae bacterium]|nr:hypothetical protein [Chlamydiota bacterium]